MDKTVSSNFRKKANVVVTKDVVSKDWSKYNSKQIFSEEIYKTLSSNIRNDINVAERKAESDQTY